MRALVLGCAVLALGAGCGSSESISDSTPDGGFARTSPTQVNLKIATAGNGLVRGAGADCRGSCTAPYVSGTQVHLVAVPDPGASFVAWSGACSGAGGCDLTLDADREVSATFAAAPPPPPSQVHLSASTSGPGTVAGGGLNCGESSSTCDVTVASGSTVNLTAAAAGGARFAGWGGACGGTSATCQLTLQSDVRVTAEFLSEVLALAPDDGTNVPKIALNSTHVFWPRYVNGSFGIWSISKSGGDAVRVAAGSASAIVADDAYLYWTDGSNIYSTPVGGGQVALLFTAPSVGRLALDEVGALYWTGTGASDGGVFRMQDRVATLLAKGENPAGALDVDATHLYFTAWDGRGFLRRVPRGGGAVEQVLSCGSGCYPQAVRVDPQHVYFRSWKTPCDSTSGQVQAVSKADFSVRSLSDGNGTSNCAYDIEVDVNASVVYWNWTSGTAPYGIFRANASGNGFAAIDSGNSSWPTVRVDDVAVYYWRAGAIIRRLK